MYSGPHIEAGRDGCLFADDVFNFLFDNCYVSFSNLIEIYIMPPLILMIAWCQTDDILFCESITRINYVVVFCWRIYVYSVPITTCQLKLLKINRCNLQKNWRRMITTTNSLADGNFHSIHWHSN